MLKNKCILGTKGKVRVAISLLLVLNFIRIETKRKDIDEAALSSISFMYIVHSNETILNSILNPLFSVDSEMKKEEVERTFLWQFHTHCSLAYPVGQNLNIIIYHCKRLVLCFLDFRLRISVSFCLGTGQWRIMRIMKLAAWLEISYQEKLSIF